MSSSVYGFKEISAEELAAVAELKARLQLKWTLPSDDASNETIPYFEFSDTAILRFYRGRKGEIDKAYNALCRTTKWRFENNVDAIDAAAVQSEIDSGKLICSGVDLFGRPCVNVIVRKHRSDTRDLEVIEKFIIFSFENILRSTIPADEKIVIIFDLHEFSFANMDYEVVKLLIDILQFNYPETLSCLAIINSPFIFSACWLVIKPWLDPDTRAKIVFASRSDLGNLVDVTTLPKELYLA